MKRALFLILHLLFGPLLLSAQLYINELVQSNVNGIIDDTNDFPDSWVEIRNAAHTAVWVNALSIGLTNDPETAYKLPSFEIAADSFLVIYCDKKATRYHTDFRLNSDEPGQLFLFNNGTVIDSVDIPEMPAPDIPYGRLPDSTNVWAHFKQITPYASNTATATEQLLPNPKFSVKGGFFQDTVPLILSLKRDDLPQDVVIRYTTNGSEPTEQSEIAPDTLFITQTTVVRAKLFSDSALCRISKTHSYIFFDRKVTLPVFSIVMDSTYLYDDEIGIYTDGTYAESHPEAVSQIPSLGSQNYMFNWRRPANVEFFALNADSLSQEINQLCEMRIGGNTSRLDSIRRSFVLHANKRFGKKHFAYPFWHDKPNLTKSKALYLRNAGSDRLPGAYIRDAYQQMVYGRNTGIDWSAYEPCIILVNGEYAGILNLRELAKEEFVWANYDKLEDIDFMDNYTASEGDATEFWRLMSEIVPTANSIEILEEVMDLDEYIDYFCLNTFFANVDFPGNNYIMWCERVSNSKWRWIAKDMDLGCGVPYAYDFRSLNYNLRVEPYIKREANDSFYCSLFKKLMSFESVEKQYIDKMSVYMGTFSSSVSCHRLLDSLEYNLSYEMPYFADLYSDWTLKWWEAAIDSMRNWVVNRVPFEYADIRDFFQLGDTVALRVYSELPDTLRFNDIVVKNNHFKGWYYYDREIRLSQSDEPLMWLVNYEVGDSLMSDTLIGQGLTYIIPDSVRNVYIKNCRMADEFPGEPTSVANALVWRGDAVYDVLSVDGRTLKTNVSMSDYRHGLHTGVYILRERSQRGILHHKFINR